MAKSSADIRKELEAAEARERAEQKTRKEATPPQFEYWIVPTKINGNSSYGKLYDPTCHLYDIDRRVINREDARAVGWTDSDMKEGRATYLYNTVTRRIIGMVGGGTSYINRSFVGEPEDYADDTAFFHLGTYLAEYPGGGDITYIVDDFKAARKAASNGKIS
jgi:hypothetical protein